MALKNVKRCKMCGHKLDAEGVCTNLECSSNILAEIGKTIEELKSKEPDDVTNN